MTVRLRELLRSVPVTLGLCIVITASGVFAGSLHGGHPTILAVSPEGLAAGHWWTPLTALFVPDSVIELALTLLLVAVAMPGVERLLGSVRAALTIVGVGIAAMLVGTAVQAVSTAQGAAWAMLSGDVLDPAVGIVGAIMVASALAPVLWRRRTRLLGFSVLVMFTLYAGDVDSVYRLCAAVLGLVLGMLLARRRRHAPWHRSSYGEVRTLVAAIVAVTGIGPLIVLLTGRGIGPLSPVVQGLRGRGIDAVLSRCDAALTDQCAVGLADSAGPLLMSMVPLVLTVVAAVGLRVGRRAALILAIIVNLVVAGLAAISIGADDLRHPAELAIINRVFPGFAVVAILVPLSVCAALIVLRKRFTVRARSGEGRRTALWIVTVLIVLAVADSLLVFRAGIDLPVSVLDAVQRFLPAGFTHAHIGLQIGGLANFARQSVGPLFWAFATAMLLRLLRAPVAVAASVDDVAYRDLLRVHSGTLGFLGTWEGNRHWFTPDGRGGIAYRVISGFAISVSDPVGAKPHRVVRGFADFCDRNGWSPVLYSVHTETVAAVEQMGWAHMTVAEETVVPLERFSLEGKAWAKVRQPYRRADREGLHAEWTRWVDLSSATLSQLNALSEQWVAEKALPEMGFTLGGVEELQDPEVALMLAVGPKGDLHGITSWLPIHRDGALIGWTLDFMRRSDDAMPGVMEFLLASAALRMKADGLAVMSLSGAPLAQSMSPEEGEDIGGMQRLLHWLGSVMEPAYGFRSLLSFKAKFHPDRATLSMAYPDAAVLPGIGLALARAYLPHVTASEYLALARTLRG